MTQEQDNGGWSYLIVGLIFNNHCVSEAVPTDQMLPQNTETKMEDKWYMAHVLFYSLGVASVIPAHFFPTATDVSTYIIRFLLCPDF